jgi:Periplasmic binding protein-like domain
MEEEGLVARESSIDSVDETESGYLGTKSLLASDEPITAILAGNDPTAHGVYKALRDRGSKVPDDISVVDLRARDQQAPLQSDSSGAVAPAEGSFRTPEAIQAIVDPWLTDDPVFGKIKRSQPGSLS